MMSSAACSWPRMSSARAWNQLWRADDLQEEAEDDEPGRRSTGR